MKKETEEWMRIAVEDFQSAKYLLEKFLFRMVCYHSQQAFEKLAKAILVENNVDIPQTHNLIDLNNAIRRLGYTPPVSAEDVVFMNAIYLSDYPFYEGSLLQREPNEKEAEKALEIAKNLTIWSREKLAF